MFVVRLCVCVRVCVIKCVYPSVFVSTLGSDMMGHHKLSVITIIQSLKKKNWVCQHCPISGLSFDSPFLSPLLFFSA